MRKIYPCSCVILLSFAALAQPGGNYRADNIIATFGGGDLSGGNYQATVSIGQIDAMDEPSSGGQWTVDGGLWPIQAATNDAIFAHGFEN